MAGIDSLLRTQPLETSVLWGASAAPQKAVWKTRILSKALTGKRENLYLWASYVNSQRFQLRFMPGACEAASAASLLNCTDHFTPSSSSREMGEPPEGAPQAQVRAGLPHTGHSGGTDPGRLFLSGCIPLAWGGTGHSYSSAPFLARR